MAHRYYLVPEAWAGADVALGPEESRHLTRVLRVRPGEAVTLFDGRGRVGRAEVREVTRNRVTVRIADERREPGPVPRVTLFQAVPKGTAMEGILQKATELGAAEIVPLLTERVVLRLEGDRVESRRERWQRVALEAAKQCETAWVPAVAPPVRVAGIGALLGGCDRAWVGSLRPGAVPFRTALRDLRPDSDTRVAVIIGPEGDLTPAEVDAVEQAGAVPVSFGPLTLRVETAAIFALSAIRYEFGAG